LVTAFLVVFVAEWGDLTQLATAALQARYQRPVPVLVASTLALWSVSALAVVVGNRLGALLPRRPLELAAAGITAVIGILLISGLVG
jgi:putative Ca2+/H+ antiporter (TMEM165/GDT1 family)